MKLKKLEDFQYYAAGLAGAYHLVYYMPDKDDVTNWTHRVIEFKNGESPVDYAEITNLMTEAILEADFHFDYVTRVLGHNEIKALNKAPIIPFVKEIANATGANYHPQLLNKTRTTRPLHTLPTLQERKDEVRGVFFVKDKELDLNYKRLLIVDDITTSCTTIAEMVKTLKSEWPNIEIYLLCLARTIHNEPNANQNL